jgi:hypothetical protein
VKRTFAIFCLRNKFRYAEVNAEGAQTRPVVPTADQIVILVIAPENSLNFRLFFVVSSQHLERKIQDLSLLF